MNTFKQSIKDLRMIIAEQARISKKSVVLASIEGLLRSLMMALGIFMPKLIMDYVTEFDNISKIIFSIIIYVIMTTVISLVMVKIDNFHYLSGYYLPHEWMKKLAHKMMRMDYATVNTGAFEQMYLGAENASFELASKGDEVIRGAIATITELVMLGTIAVSLDYLVAGILVICAGISIFLDSRINAYNYEYKRSVDREMVGRNYATCILHGFFPGFKDLLVYNGGELICGKVTESYNNAFKLFHTKNKRELGLKVVQYLIGAFELVVIYFAVIRKFMLLDNYVTAGYLVMYVSAASELKTVLNNVIAIAMSLGETHHYMEVFNEVLMQEEKIRNSGTKQVKSGDHTLEFKNVSFSYGDDQELVLKNISFSMTPGERIALVGDNGAGKTTLANLILRLYDIDEGAIYLDGINIKEYDYGEYQRVFSAVFQDYQMFDAPIRENIDFGNQSDMISNSILEGLSLGELDDNSSAEWLSGGQKQLVALARALRKQADIGIFDEVTSSIDPIIEADVYGFIDEMMKGKSIFTISHRLSVCTSYDRILFLKDGRLVENGSHKELMELDGEYAYMFRMQAEGYEKH